MAIASVVTMGYSVAGGYSGGTATLPTLGYQIGAVIVPDSEGLQAAYPGRPLHAKAANKVHGRFPGKPLHVRREAE